MAASGFSAVNAAAIALTAATARTVLGVKAATGQTITLVSYSISFDGVTASAIPALCEICKCTFATNAPGTNSTSITPISMRGPQLTALSTSASTWTATNEPTVITVIDRFDLTPNGGTVLFQFPLGREVENAVGTGFSIRLTAPASVNFNGSITWEE